MAIEPTWIEVADTAIKIGAGGIISILATRFSNNRSHKLELEKINIQEKISSFREIITLFLRAESKFNNLILSVHYRHCELSKKDNCIEDFIGSKEFFAEQQVELLNISNDVFQACINASTVGKNDLYTQLSIYGKHVSDVSVHLFDKRENIDPTYIIKKRNAMYELTDIIKEQFEIDFGNLTKTNDSNYRNKLLK